MVQLKVWTVCISEGPCTQAVVRFNQFKPERVLMKRQSYADLTEGLDDIEDVTNDPKRMLIKVSLNEVVP